MSRFNEYDEEDRRHKKRLKRASNRPGEGMRIINKYVEDEVSVYDNTLETEDTLSFDEEEYRR